MGNRVSLKDLQDEIKDMLSVCFVGEVSEQGERIELMLESGQRFNVYVGEAK